MEQLLIGVLVLTGVAAFFAVLVGFTIYRGWVLSYLWKWFLVPIGFPELSLPQCIGIALAVAFLTHQHQREAEDKRTDNEKIVAGVIYVLGPMITLGFGWIVKQYLM